MKKLIIISGIVLAIIIVLLLVLPVVFKPQIVQAVKGKAGQTLNADFNFRDVGLSLISSFPNASLTIDDLSIVNRAPFEGDTLLYAKKVAAVINLPRLIFGGQIAVTSFHVDGPQITVMVFPDGRANYMIFPTSPETKTAPAQKTGNLNLAISHYEINNAYILFIDQASNNYAQIVGLTHSGSGDFDKSLFTLATRTRIADLSVRSQNIDYLSHAVLESKIDLEMDLINKKYTFKEDEIHLNQLSLASDGWVQTAEEKINLDISFRAPKTEFKSILSMIPAVYTKDFSDLKAEGRLLLEGKIAGTFSKTQVPMLDIKLIVEDGMLQYPKLPSAVRNVQINLAVTNPGKTVDDTQVNLSKFHLEIGEEPVDAQLLIKTPKSDPYVDGFLKGNIDLGRIRNMMPLGDTIKLAGTIRSDFVFKGNLSALQKKDIGKFTANGTVACSNIEYAAPSLPQPVTIRTATLNLAPQRAQLTNLNMEIGKSDMQADGNLENIFGYVFGGQTLKGNLSLNSNFLDLNPFLQQKGAPLAAVELPDKVEFLMTGNFKRVLLTNMDMNNVRGKLLLKDRTLYLNDISANMLDGTMTTNGFYRYVRPEDPHINLDLKLTQLSIPAMFRTFITVQKFAPMAEYMQGKVDGSLNLSSDLGDSLMPRWQSVLGNGALQIMNARMENFKPLNSVADALKLSQFRDPSLANLAPSFEIKNGFFNLNPLSFNIGDYQVLASGANGLDQSLDYLLKVQIPAGELKSQANSAISSLIKKDVSLLTNETVVVDVGIKGFIKDPKIQTSLAQITKGATEQIKQQAVQEAEKKKQELQQQLDQQKAAAEDSLKKAVEKQKHDAAEKLKGQIKSLFEK